MFGYNATAALALRWWLATRALPVERFYRRTMNALAIADIVVFAVAAHLGGGAESLGDARNRLAEVPIMATKSNVVATAAGGGRSSDRRMRDTKSRADGLARSRRGVTPARAQRRSPLGRATLFWERKMARDIKASRAQLEQRPDR